MDENCYYQTCRAAINTYLQGSGNQCCGSGMFIPDPDFYPSRIPDPGSRIPDPKTATKERCEKKLYVKPFYVATKFDKIVNYFSF
jgi:hypothetical protein